MLDDRDSDTSTITNEEDNDKIAAKPKFIKTFD